jgi:hypothetical protein
LSDKVSGFLYGREAICDFLRISKGRYYSWVDEGLPVRVIKNRLVAHTDELNTWLRANHASLGESEGKIRLVPRARSFGKKKIAQRITNPTSPRLLSLKKAAEYLGLTIWAMRERIWAGNIPVVRFPGGRKQFLDVQDLEQFIHCNKTIIE